MHFDRLKRREFIALLGGAAVAWPLAVRAQQPAMPVIGFLGASSPSGWSSMVVAFQQRLRELGWIEGRTVVIEYRWAEGQDERYAEIAAEFVRLKVDVIVTSGAAVTAAKQATSSIPIVFVVANNPLGLVASRGRQCNRSIGAATRSGRQAPRNHARDHPRIPPCGDHGQYRLSRSGTRDDRG